MHESPKTISRTIPGPQMRVIACMPNHQNKLTGTPFASCLSAFAAAVAPQNNGRSRRHCWPARRFLEAFLLLILALIGIVGVVELPALGLIKLVDLSLHIFDDLVLQRRELSLPVKHALVACQQHIQAYQLPFGDALGLLDVGERIAREVPSAISIDLAKLAIFALNHVLTPI